MEPESDGPPPSKSGSVQPHMNNLWAWKATSRLTYLTRTLVARKGNGGG